MVFIRLEGCEATSKRGILGSLTVALVIAESIPRIPADAGSSFTLAPPALSFPFPLSLRAPFRIDETDSCSSCKVIELAREKPASSESICMGKGSESGARCDDEAMASAEGAESGVVLTVVMLRADARCALEDAELMREGGGQVLRAEAKCVGGDTTLTTPTKVLHRATKGRAEG